MNTQPTRARQPRRLSFPLFIALAMSLVVLVVALVLAGQTYREAMAQSLAEQERQLDNLTRMLRLRVTANRNLVTAQLRLMAQSKLQEAASWPERERFLPQLMELLPRSGANSSVFARFDNGDQLMLTRQPGGDARWQVRQFDAASQQERLILLDEDGAPRQRSRRDVALPAHLGQAQFEQALASDRTVQLPLMSLWPGEPPVIATLQAASNHRSVFGVAAALTDIRTAIAQQIGALEGYLLVIDRHSRRLIHADPALLGANQAAAPLLTDLPHPLLRALAQTLSPAPERHDPHGVTLTLPKGEQWQIRHLDEGTRPDVELLYAVPADLLHQRAVAKARQFTLSLLLCFAPAIPLIGWMTRRMSRPLHQLTQEIGRIGAFQLDERPLPEAPVSEFHALVQAIRRMRDALRNFVNIGESLVAKQDLLPLLQGMLEETNLALQAEGGAILLREGDAFTLAAACWHGRELPAMATPLSLEHHALFARPLQGHPHWSDLDDALWRPLAFFGQRPSGAGVAIEPLKDHGGRLEGFMLFVLPAMAPTRRDGHLALLRACSGSAASAVLTQRLLHEQKSLLDAMVRLLADTIDAKSPHTGGHCRRVPELALQLARAASASQEGELAGFTPGPDQWEAIELASWLHDCGKITTPEFVVDKATKLETPYNRIHEIRTRFEVLKRDALIAALDARLSSDEQAAARAAIAPQWCELDEEFAFVARCNQGNEFMRDEDQARVRAIGKRTWLRTLSLRLGLSHEERARLPAGAEQLPACEPLLSDRPEQRIPHAAPPPTDPRFTLQSPECLYDQGELHNLTVSRGTLTHEERYKINEHIIQTIRMLEALPFPRHLAEVPLMAGGHHERADGKGYPAGLTSEQTHLCARIIAIADVFEALTASDRPYKSPKRLGEALAIMRKMTDGGHFDPALFALFVSSGIWRNYGQQHLASDQCDEVDEVALLAGL
ncbi:HD domain-containing phosphohydrolase [Aeromonas simiae]|uniref:HD domain-containing phosphohydrolase n=1 Tax=Aeromonas simiae TaxID=218936 RepID=UPI00266C2CBF|nr:HD domain-containing phosphohydrolase [Aeromonas simiae]MDO2953412.1 HAMP domain-containing protein [Aeromonas simiae]